MPKRKLRQDLTLNGWMPIRGKEDYPTEDGFYWVTYEGKVFQCHIYPVDGCWNGDIQPSAWMPIVKPEPYERVYDKISDPYEGPSDNTPFVPSWMPELTN